MTFAMRTSSSRPIQVMGAIIVNLDRIQQSFFYSALGSASPSQASVGKVLPVETDIK